MMRSLSLILKTCVPVIASLGCAVCGAARHVVGQENSLLLHAQKTADFKLTVVDPRHPDYAHSYYWLSTSRLLHCYCLDEPGMGLRMVTQQIDLHTGHCTPLTAPIENLDLGEVAGGPGGRWLIQNIVHSSGTLTTAFKADGTAAALTNFGSHLYYDWNEDGHRVYEFFAKQRGRTLIIEHDLERPAYLKRFWTSISDFASYSYTITADRQFIGYKISTSSGQGHHRQQVDVLQAVLKRSIVAVHRYRFFLPEKQNCTLEFSPDGRRLLWTAIESTSQETKQTCRYAYFVSDINGKHKQNLGLMSEDSTSNSGATQLQWLPDSRHIGFLYRSNAYIVSTH